jgi:hypothetical protein
MPSKSKAQQKFMGMVHALKKGELDPSSVSKDVKKVAQSMSDKDAKDFASTSHKGLPRKVKQEILNRLKEYANKMGTDHLGGDDYTSSKKGGLRDFDGYDNVDYNKDMPMDESNLKGQLAGDSVQDIIKSIGSRFVSGEIKNTKRDGKTYIKLKDEKFGSGVVKILKSRFGIDAKIDYYGGKGKVASSPSVSFWSDTILEAVAPANWMQGRTSDYHTKLRGKEREYDDTNFEKDNSGQPDLEESFNELEHLKLLNLAIRTMPGSPKQKEIIRKLNKVRVAGGMKPLKEGDLEDAVHQVKKFDKPKDEKLLTIKVINKLKDKRNKSKSASNKQKLQKMIDKIEGDYKKGKYIKEYASNQTLSFLPLDQDEIDKMNETMIRRAVDLAQEILPKDTWSRHASDGKKNKEFVKSIVRDLAQLLNRFYKSHDVDVRIKEEVLKEVLAGRIGQYTGSSPMRLVPARIYTIKNEKDKEKTQAIEKDLAYHLNTFWKKWNFPYRIDLSKKHY